MPIYDEEYWMEQGHRRQWEERLAEAYQQEQYFFEQMKGQYFTKEEQQEQEDRKRYPLFFLKEGIV